MATNDDIIELEKIVVACRPYLAGHDPAIQSAALGELVAIWLCGVPDTMRAGLLLQLNALIKNIMPMVELEFYRGETHPQNQGLPNAGMIL
jgi:hypothetical protein